MGIIKHGVTEADLTSTLAAYVKGTELDTTIDNLPWKYNVQYEINYTKASAPSGGAATTNEKCLNTANYTVYEFGAGAWSVFAALNVGDRLIWKTTGSDNSGASGTYTATDKIYYYTGSALTPYTPTTGDIVPLDSDEKRYRYVSGSGWTEMQCLATDSTTTVAYSASNYTPTAGGKLENHLSGIDTALVGVVASDTTTTMSYSPNNYTPTVGGKLCNHVEGIDTELGICVNKDANNNVGIGTNTFGTNAVNVLAIKNGTAPTTSPSDSVQLFAKDSGFDSYTMLLLHFDGENGGTIFSDASRRHANATATNATTSTERVKYGTSAGKFSGTGYIEIADSDDFYYGTGNFTIDFWLNLISVPATDDWADMIALYHHGPNLSAEAIAIYIGKTKLVFWAGGAELFRTDHAGITSNTWHHIALVRNGNTFTFYQNGTACATTGSTTDAMPNETVTLVIGCEERGTAGFLNGYLDEYRISKGVARWTSNFTAPTEAYAPTFSELWVRDEAGNETVLSPHNFEGIPNEVVTKNLQESKNLAWTYHSRSGEKKITVDMYGAIKELERLAGKKFIYIGE